MAKKHNTAEQRQVIAALQKMLEEARSGRLEGFVGAVMYSDPSYVPLVTGHCRRNPTWSRGMLQCVNDELERILRTDFLQGTSPEPYAYDHQDEEYDASGQHGRHGWSDVGLVELAGPGRASKQT